MTAASCLILHLWIAPRCRWRPLLVAAGLSLAGCGTLAPPATETPGWSTLQRDLQELQHWQLRGRVNVRYESQSWTPRILWQQQDAHYRIRLWGSFNTGNTTIAGQPGRVTLQQGDTVLTADSAEELVLQQLGYELPISCLEYWIRGLPAPASPAELAFNETNQLHQMKQDGWTITYSDARQYGHLVLPARVDVSRPLHGLQLRFVGLNWTPKQAPP